jgi:K+-transporting ATPase KdpF subunit
VRAALGAFAMFEILLGAAVAIGLFVYLLVALLAPEKF